MSVTITLYDINRQQWRTEGGWGLEPPLACQFFYIVYPLAIYVHCCSHSLNLAVSDACTVTPIRNCMHGHNWKYLHAHFLQVQPSFITQVNDRLLQHKALQQNFRCLMPKEPKTPPTATQVDELRHLYATYAGVLDCSELSAIGELQLW